MKNTFKKYLLTHVHSLISGMNIELQSCLEHYRQVTLVSIPHKTHHWPCYDCPDERGE